jgi:hypothetical protein
VKARGRRAGEVAAVGRRGSGGGFKVRWWIFLARAEEDDVWD